MKVLLVTYHFPPEYGGIQKVMKEIVEGLKNEIEITVLAPFSNQKDENSGYELIRSPYKKIVPSILWYNYIFYKLKDEYDIILGSTWKTLSTVIPGVINTSADIIYVAHGSDVTRDSNNLLLDKIYSILNRKVTRIVAVSNFTKNKINKRYIDKVKVINNGIDTKKPIKISDIKSDKFTITTVAQLEPRKGHVEYLDIFPQLLEKINNVEYNIIGNGIKYDEISNKINEKGLGDCVNLVGNVDDDELQRYYSKTNVFLLPNITKENGRDFEGFGIVLLEASLYKIPVVAGSHGGTNDIIRHGYNGYLFGEDNMESINDYIFKLYKDRQLRNDMGNNAHQMALNFDIKNMIQEYRSLLFEIASGAGK